MDTLGLLLRDTGRYAESEAVLKRVQAICERNEALEAQPVCVAVSERFVRLYSRWDEDEPEGGYDVLKRQWEDVQNAPDPNAN